MPRPDLGFMLLVHLRVYSTTTRAWSYSRLPPPPHPTTTTPAPCPAHPPRPNSFSIFCIGYFCGKMTLIRRNWCIVPFHHVEHLSVKKLESPACGFFVARKRGRGEAVQGLSGRVGFSFNPRTRICKEGHAFCCRWIDQNWSLAPVSWHSLSLGLFSLCVGVRGMATRRERQRNKVWSSLFILLLWFWMDLRGFIYRQLKGSTKRLSKGNFYFLNENNILEYDCFKITNWIFSFTGYFFIS